MLCCWVEVFHCGGASDPLSRWSINTNFNAAKRTAAAGSGPLVQLCQKASKAAALAARFQ